MIEIPFLKVTKKVKSMQMFHKPVQTAMQVHKCGLSLVLLYIPIVCLCVCVCVCSFQGDRVGICVTQFDPKQVERCLMSSPGYLPTLEGEYNH